MAGLYRLGFLTIGLGLALVGGVDAFAADPPLIATAPSGSGAPSLGSPPISTAKPSTPPDDGTGAQINGWITSQSATSPPQDQPRTVHGEMGVGVGSNGYRSVYGVADIPIGQTGDLVVAASNTSGQVRGGRYGGYGGGGGSLALGFSMNGSDASAPVCGRQRWTQAQASDGQASAGPGAATCGGGLP